MAMIRERRLKNGETRYQVVVRIKGYPVQRNTFISKTKAKRWAQEVEVAIRDGKHFKTAESRKYTVGEMIDRYLEETLSSDAKQYNTKQGQLRWWKEQIGAYALSMLTPDRIGKCRDLLAKGTVGKSGKQRSQATANRYLTTFSGVVTIAVNEWGWLNESPMSRVKKFKEPRGRVRFLDEEERERLLESCTQSKNSQLHTIVVLALSTGMRQGEILSLTWTDVDLVQGKAILHETKNGERRVVPIVGHALELLKQHKAMQKLDTLLVFPGNNGKQPAKIRSSWEEAVKRADIKNFRFHDLRHTCASYLVMNGASSGEIAEVLGHKTLAMVKRYAHLSEAHTAGVVTRMNERIFG